VRDGIVLFNVLKGVETETTIWAYTCIEPDEAHDLAYVSLASLTELRESVHERPTVVSWCSSRACYAIERGRRSRLAVVTSCVGSGAVITVRSRSPELPTVMGTRLPRGQPSRSLRYLGIRDGGGRAVDAVVGDELAVGWAALLDRGLAAVGDHVIPQGF
jgi:hypothetical protein